MIKLKTLRNIDLQHNTMKEGKYFLLQTVRR